MCEDTGCMCEGRICFRKKTLKLISDPRADIQKDMVLISINLAQLAGCGKMFIQRSGELFGTYPYPRSAAART